MLISQKLNKFCDSLDIFYKINIIMLHYKFGGGVTCSEVITHCCIQTVTREKEILEHEKAHLQ